ncbi:MAG: SET domain-containing protein [Cytophaga sp.]|uniref:SET domain-containing protein n=1 Tax=Cytophaga sp. TaxID=29535 RepID=UPI003F7D00CF
MTQINHSIVVKKQCAYKDSTGKRCKTICTLTHPYCPEHTASELSFRVDQSTVPFAGLGLFTLKKIKKGSVALLYEGEKLTIDQYNKRYDKEGHGEYGMTLGKKHVIDARKTSSGLGRFVCDFTGSGKKANVEYLDNDGVIEIVAKKKIKAGEELLVDYGDEMRTAMGFQPEKKKKDKKKKSDKKKKKK